jgi:hypothetical protein
LTFLRFFLGFFKGVGEPTNRSFDDLIVSHLVVFVKPFFQLFLKSFVVAISTTTRLDIAFVMI